MTIRPAGNFVFEASVFSPIKIACANKSVQKGYFLVPVGKFGTKYHCLMTESYLDMTDNIGREGRLRGVGVKI